MSSLNDLDWAICALIFFSFVIGIMRGFIKELISILTWIAAFIVSSLYSAKFAHYLPSSLKALTPESASLSSLLVSYVVLFLGVLACGTLIKTIVNYLVEGGGLSVINRVLGAFFGVLRGCIVVLLVLFFLGYTAITTHPIWKESKLLGAFQPGIKQLNIVSEPYIALLKVQMKNLPHDIDQEDLSDVIKAKLKPEKEAAPKKEG